jgi:hypothetical protein
MKGAGTSPKVAVVTGDVTMDWNLMQRRSAGSPGAAAVSWTDDRVRACWQRGGAALLADLVSAVGASAGWDVRQMQSPLDSSRVLPGDRGQHHAYALWSAYPRRGAGKDERPWAWRVKEFLGRDGSVDDAPAPWQFVENDPAHPGVVFLDDAGHGFRNHPELWPKAVNDLACSAPIVLKMARPVAQGALWDHLVTHCAQRLVVIVPVNDLRETQVQISRDLSWERTAQDVYWEVVNNPHITGMSRCAQVIISFYAAGALWLARRSGEVPDWDCTLLFDPRHTESSASLVEPGKMIGYTSCLAASLAWQLMHSGVNHGAITQGIQGGVGAMRLLHQGGYDGPTPDDPDCSLRFPIERIARRILDGKAPAPLQEAVVQNPTAYLRKPTLAGGRHASGFWTILEDRYPTGMEKVAFDIVEKGIDAALSGVPFGQFAKLTTVDRREIESYRSIRALLLEYCGRPQKRPISIAVFGPPGAGKSFGVEQVANSVQPDDIKVLTFNLSQFGGPDDLIGAFHQVRDVGLSGKMPLVFWDEFDSQLAGQELGWLRYFLAPMQDGAFQEGQLTHSLGQAIFVFAGGVRSTMADFQSLAAEAKSMKGPDFASRLKGYVNVLGPDPRLPRHPADDHTYVIRRAILLRSLFERSAGHLFVNGHLSIDPGVLRAFLTISRYKHGVRSMESIIAMSALAGKSRFERSCLPSEAQLDLHVSGVEFLSLVQQPDLHMPVTSAAPPRTLLELLAEATHQVYCEDLAGKPDAPDTARKCYDDLPENLRQQNRDYVRDIPNKLSLIGHVMLPARSMAAPFGFPGKALEYLSELEHERWLLHKVRDGWRYGQKRDDSARTNPAILPWREPSPEERAQLDPAVRAALGPGVLPDAEKDKDRILIRNIPRILGCAGYAVVPLQVEESAPS